MRLQLAREAGLEIQSESDLKRALLRLGDANEFAILSRSTDDFIQAGVDGDGFVVNRSGSAARTLLWASPKSDLDSSTNRHQFTLQGVQDLFVDYYRREPLAQWNWRFEQLPEPTVASRLGIFLLKYALWPTLIVIAIAGYYVKYFR